MSLCWRIGDLETLSQFSSVLFGEVNEENSSVLNNNKEVYPKAENSFKYQLNFFHSTYCVNYEYTVQKDLKVILVIRKKIKRIFLMVDRLLRLGLISPVCS